MALHFERAEYEARLARTRTEMAARGLDAMLFAPESHYYLTGYDTFGFAMFQCMVLPADGKPHLITRAPDLPQAQQTSIVEEQRIHLDAHDQLTLEWSGAYRRYHAAMMRTLVIGPPNDLQKRMHADRR